VHFLNLGILAHVDAGKTSLTERLLFTAGVIDEPGSVDAGSTRTDSMELERQRGITIKAAVVSFPITDDVTVNLIDTPGHPDFIAEVERALSVLDGAILVVSAVEGIQAQTRVLLRALKRMRLPTLIFVNKTDRRNAEPERVLAEIANLVPAAPMTAKEADLLDLLAEHDDALLASYVNDEEVDDLTESLKRQTARATTHPVYFGSAITGAGVSELMNGIADLLPTADADPEAPLGGRIFKVDRGPAGERIAYVRMFAGTLRVRDRLGPNNRITGIDVFDHGGSVARQAVEAGRIATLRGLSQVKIGDALGTASDGHGFAFVPPSLETVVEPTRDNDAGALHAALAQLAEQDPLINLRQQGRKIAVSLYGEVQKEVIEATLKNDYGLDVEFQETTTIHVERLTGEGEAVEVIATDGNPFLATVGLRIEPGSGNSFHLGVELGSMPYAFFVAVEETVERTLREGLYGWQVIDCTVTMTRSGYWARQSRSHGTFDKSMSSTAGDFRNLTPLVLMQAMGRAGTRVHEPVHAFHLDCPTDLLPAVLPTLAKHRAVPLGTAERGITGTVPAASVHDLQIALPSLTKGEGLLETTFDHYRPVVGPAPKRERSDHNPLNRKEYLLAVVRRVT
jgi:ribosomal protection tetracycline resistance protein